jgi:uncharacterized protein YciI
MKRLLACLAIALSGIPAWAQIRVDIAADDNGCKQLRVTNTSDHKWEVLIPYQYVGEDAAGRPATYDFQVHSAIGPKSTLSFSTSGYDTAGQVACRRNYHFQFFPWQSQDLTAVAEAENQRVNDSREAVIRAELERQETVKRQNAEYQRQKEAEATTRAQAEADRKAEEQRNLQTLADLKRMQDDYTRQQQQKIIAAGDPRCNTSFDLDGFRACNKIIEAADAEAARKKQQEAEFAKTHPGPPAFAASFSPINPQTCAPPGVAYTANTQADADYIKRESDRRVTECLQNRNTLQAQQLQAQRAAAEQAAQQQALQQAQLQQQLQQTMNNGASEFQQTGQNFQEQSRNIQQSNADLEEWLRTH